MKNFEKNAEIQKRAQKVRPPVEASLLKYT